MCYNIEGSDVDVEAKDIPSPEEVSMDKEGMMLDEALGLDAEPVAQEEICMKDKVPDEASGLDLMSDLSNPVLDSLANSILKAVPNQDLTVDTIEEAMLNPWIAEEATPWATA